MVPGARQDSAHTRAGIILGVLLLHGGLVCWLPGLQQTRTAQALPSRIVVQMRTVMPQTAARPLPVMSRPSHPARHLPMTRPASLPPAPAMPFAPARPAAPAVLAGTATAISTSLAGQTATPAPTLAEAHPPASTEAGFTADYLHNPAPRYPPSARRNGEEGRVLLRVRVSADGQADEVEIQHSSGFPRLDEAAREAVANWRFTPARRGTQAIASTVIVPITFRLGH